MQVWVGWSEEEKYGMKKVPACSFGAESNSIISLFFPTSSMIEGRGRMP
jgi:hypothetical protein